MKFDFHQVAFQLLKHHSSKGGVLEFLRSKSIHWWMTALTTVFVVLLSVFSFIARKPLCIDSKVVDRIDIQLQSQRELSVYRCGYYKRVEFNPLAIELTKEINAKLNTFERSLEILGGLKNRIVIKISEESELGFTIQNSVLTMPLNQVRHQGQIEKAILKLWYMENASDELKNRLLFSEVFTDFLFHSLYGNLKIADVESGIEIETELDSRWPQVLSNQKNYCESIWKSPELKADCQTNKLITDSREIFVMSLRPLLTQAMIESFEFLEPSEKMQFLRKFGRYLSEMKYLDKVFGMTVQSKDRQTYFDAIFEVENFKYLLNRLKIDSQESRKLAHYFDFEMKKLGFIDAEVRSIFDVVIVSNNPSQRLLDHIPYLFKKKSKKFFAFETGRYLTVDLKKEPLSIEVMGLVQAHRGILVQCETPSVSEMRKYSEKFQRIIYVRDCEQSPDSSEKLQLEDLIQGDVLKFARRNPQLKFAEFHMPSLMMALNKVPDIEIVETLSKKNWKALSVLGFEDPTFDESSKAFKSNSAISFVNFFRL